MMQVKHLYINLSKEWWTIIPDENSKKKRSEDTHQMKIMNSKRRKKSRSLKIRGSRA